MTTYETRIQSPWTAADAFDYLSDLRNFEDWDPGTKQAVQVSGDGPGLGSRYELTVGKATLTYEVEEHDRPTRVRARGTDRFFTSIDTISVTPDEGGSVVTYHADLTLNGPLRIGDPILGLFFHRMGEKAADSLATKLDGARIT